MIPFFVSYQTNYPNRTIAAIVIADGVTNARNEFKEKLLDGPHGVTGVDKRQIKVSQLKALEFTGKELSEPKILKTVG